MAVAAAQDDCARSSAPRATYRLSERMCSRSLRQTYYRWSLVQMEPKMVAELVRVEIR
jgi:hypothetical protein